MLPLEPGCTLQHGIPLPQWVQSAAQAEWCTLTQCNLAPWKRATRHSLTQNSKSFFLLLSFVYSGEFCDFFCISRSPSESACQASLGQNFVAVSCHCLTHPGTWGNRGTSETANSLGTTPGCRKTALSDLIGQKGSNESFFFFQVCISRGLWSMALAFIPMFNCWINLAVILVVFKSLPFSCSQHSPRLQILCLVPCIATINCLGWRVQLLICSLWMPLTSNCWESFFKHQIPTLFFKLSFEVAEMLLKDSFLLILDKTFH